MAEFPAPEEGVLITYLVVSNDVQRSRRFSNLRPILTALRDF